MSNLYKIIIILFPAISGCINEGNTNVIFDKVDYYTLDTTQIIVDNIGEFDLNRLYYSDSTIFDFIKKKSSMKKFDSLIFELKSCKGRFYSIKNIYKPIQSICKENQVIFYKENRIKCVVCYDHEECFDKLNMTFGKL